METFVALLRAVNVGGTGKLPMAELRALCEAAGFQAVRTYIASGNVVFRSALHEAEVKAALEARLMDWAGKPMGVIVRTAAEMAEVLAANPFPDAPGNRVAAIFLDEATSPTTLDGITGKAADEDLRLGLREIYVRYGSGIGASRLVIPAAKSGTARNMNTVAKLTAMAAG
jgi:uncharacterized protein (DUF1697 family)